MSFLRQRARIARVRGIQHSLAALAAAKASGHVVTLESNQQRLKQMGEALTAPPGPSTGATLASRGELAMRLDAARHGLGQSIDVARAAASLRERARLGARRDQESAEKLEKKAASAVARNADKINGARGRPRSRFTHDGD